MEEELLIKYLNRNVTDSEAEAVESWCALTEENQKLLEQLYITYEIGKTCSVFRNSNVEEALLDCKRRIHRQAMAKRVKFIIKRVQQVAAILFVPLLLLSGYLLFQRQSGSTDLITMNTSSGIVSSFSLPDGSKVWLNANSTLKYPSRFTMKERVVELEGEAYFEVSKESRHFKVKVADNYKVEVLGTKFDVMAYKNENNIETTLIEGSVKVVAIPVGKSAREVLLKPGEMLSYTKNNGELTLTETHLNSISSWKEGKILFKNQPMERVLKILERQYNISFDVKNTKIYESRITASFENEKIEQVLDYLKLSSGLKYKINQNTPDSNDTLKIYRIELDL